MSSDHPDADEASAWSKLTYSTSVTNDPLQSSQVSDGTGFGSVPMQPGEMGYNYHHDFERPNSAPPPGFTGGGGISNDNLWSLPRSTQSGYEGYQGDFDSHHRNSDSLNSFNGGDIEALLDFVNQDSPDPSRRQQQHQSVLGRDPGSGGFPSSLSAPGRTKEQQMYRSGGMPPQGIGVVVGEPDDLPPTDILPFGNLNHDQLFNGHGLSTNAPEFMPSLSDSAGGGGGGEELSARQAEMELRPFLWNVNSNRHSRTLVLLRCSWLHVPEVRSLCEPYGEVETFVSDFSSKGIFFVSYYDIRSASYAAVTLPRTLQKALIMQRSNEDALVMYCIPWYSSSPSDESRITISELDPDMNEHALTAQLSQYGAVRSCIPQGSGSFLIEYQNLQSSKQAKLELSSTQPWGPGVAVDFATRSGQERKQGHNLLAVIGRWRASINRPARGSYRDPWQSQPPAYQQRGYSGYPGGLSGHLNGPGSVPPHAMSRPHYQPELQYAYPPPGTTQVDPQQIVRGPDGNIYIRAPPAPQFPPGYARDEHGPQSFMPARGFDMPIYPYYGGDTDARSTTSNHSNFSGRSTNDDKDNRHLKLDLDEVEAGVDTRTSLMVRNIPNKYTQQMLLSEFEENGHGPGVIDFFYLPIDFKNRCNRGYAFINFVDYKEILSFHKRYYGKHWRTFNSDKICDITYARIQGKQGMLKRFENSALLEKDDEYKPLVFISEGPQAGQRLPFPVPSNRND